MKTVSGLSLVLILFFTSIISTLVLKRWFIRSWVDDVLTSRKQWYTRFYDTELVMDVALVWIRDNRTRVFTEKDPITLRHAAQKATVVIAPVKNKPAYRIVQVTHGASNFCLSCLVTPEGDSDGHKKGRVVVSGFTLGRAL